MMSTNEAKAETPELRHPEILIRKTLRRLEVYDRGGLVRELAIVLGSEPSGDKEIEGDGRTPEGTFRVVVKNPESSFHLSLCLNYPNKEDAVRGLAAELISREEHDLIVKADETGGLPPQKTALGGEIYIHGGGCDGDWTRGCVAVDNDAMTELFALIPVGSKVTILP